MRGVGNLLAISRSETPNLVVSNRIWNRPNTNSPTTLLTLNQADGWLALMSSFTSLIPSRSAEISLTNSLLLVLLALCFLLSVLGDLTDIQSWNGDHFNRHCSETWRWMQDWWNKLDQPWNGIGVSKLSHAVRSKHEIFFQRWQSIGLTYRSWFEAAVPCLGRRP